MWMNPGSTYGDPSPRLDDGSVASWCRVSGLDYDAASHEWVGFTVIREGTGLVEGVPERCSGVELGRAPRSSVRRAGMRGVTGGGTVGPHDFLTLLEADLGGLKREVLNDDDCRAQELGS